MLRTFRNVVIAVVVLGVLFAGAGAAYVYFSGRNPDSKAQTEPQPAPAQQISLPKPRKPNPKAPVGASVQSILTPVKAGSNTSINVKTTPTARCTIEVKYGELAAKDSGLAAKTADAYGVVTWSWTVEPSAPAGTWPVKVTCKYLTRSGFVQADLKVTQN